MGRKGVWVRGVMLRLRDGRLGRHCSLPCSLDDLLVEKVMWFGSRVSLSLFTLAPKPAPSGQPPGLWTNRASRCVGGQDLLTNRNRATATARTHWALCDGSSDGRSDGEGGSEELHLVYAVCVCVNESRRGFCFSNSGVGGGGGGGCFCC